VLILCDSGKYGTTGGGAAAVDGGQPLEREALLAAITGLLDDVRAGRGAALFVVGEAGLGKTTSLSQARMLAAPVVRVGLGRGDVMETSLPFGVLAAALGAVGNHDLVASPPGDAGVNEVRAARFYGVLRWLEHTTGPVLLALDDLHWADPDSLALLSFLCRRLDGLPVAVLGTLRPWPPAAHDLVSALVHDGDASVQRLAPLSEEASAVVLATRLGRPVTETVADGAAALCAGNPLLLEQVAAAVSAPGSQVDAFLGAGAAIGAEGILLARFAGLPPEALAVARAASVLGTRFRPALATEVAGLEERQAEAALSALCRSGLVRAETDTTAAFAHPLFGQSLYHDLAAPVRVRQHARAFSVLCAHGLEAEAVEHAIRADLLGDPAAITVIERAGRAALATGALGTAVEHLRAAVRLAGDRASPALLFALGDALQVSGRPGKAIQVYERLRAQVDLGPAERVHVLRMLGRALFATGAHEQAIQRFADAAALAETCCSETTVAEVLIDDAITSYLTLGPTHSLALATRAYELTRTVVGPLRCQATAAWGYLALLSGDPAGLLACQAAADELMAGPAQLTDLLWGFGPLSLLAVAALHTERFADAERALAGALAPADRVGAPWATAVYLALRAAVATRQGRLSDALAIADQVTASVELMPYHVGFASFGLAPLMLLTGRLAECGDLCQRAEALAAARGQSYPLVLLWHIRARLLQHAGDQAGACELYARIEQVTTRLGIAEPCAVPWGRHAVVAYLASDLPDDARRVIDWLERGAARLPCRWPRIAAATGRALLAEADGDPETAEKYHQAALDLHEQVELPLEHVETLLGYGTFLRRRGQPTRARPHLAQALEIAENCGASLLADQARDELTVAGGRRRRTREDPTRLTAQEQRVAQLAAAGHSNKAIAAQLSLSSKTIEYHLAQVYTKLGINSRRQLMTGHHNL
jgi:DNA-binding CsgD family transcriptional regulator